MGKTGNKSLRKGRPNLVIKDAKDKRIVDCVVLAAFEGDEVACKEFNITPRTLSRYRKRTLEVGELSEIVSYRMKELEDTGVLDRVENTINKGLDAVARISESINPPPPDELLILTQDVLSIVEGIKKNEPKTEKAKKEQALLISTLSTTVQDFMSLYRPAGPSMVEAYAGLFEVVANYDLTRKMLHARLQGVS